MYCPSCGSQLMQSLSYCNRCGVNLQVSRISEELMPPGKNIEIVLLAGVVATITILGMILGALVLMNNGAINDKLGTAFVIVSILSLLVIDGLIAWRLLSPTRIAHKSDLAPQAQEFNPGAPRTARVLELSQPGEPSQTTPDQTTRNPEPSYRESERR